ncbi:hypothetical protein ACQEU3_06125 [Spirillospora sp. CA-253888]
MPVPAAWQGRALGRGGGLFLVPALAWLLAFTRLPEARRVCAVALATALYAAVAAGVTAWSLVGFVAA